MLLTRSRALMSASESSFLWCCPLNRVIEKPPLMSDLSQEVRNFLGSIRIVRRFRSEGLSRMYSIIACRIALA